MKKHRAALSRAAGVIPVHAFVRKFVRENDGVFEIKQTFKPDRMPICIKSAEIVIEGGAGKTVALKSADETPLPQIKRVGEN